MDTKQFKTNNNNNNNNNNNDNDNDNTNKCITKGWSPWTLFFQQGIWWPENWRWDPWMMVKSLHGQEVPSVNIMHKSHSDNGCHITIQLRWNSVDQLFKLTLGSRVAWGCSGLPPCELNMGCIWNQKKKNFCIWQYSRLAGTRKETQVRWGPIGLCPRLWIGISRFKCLLGPPCCVLRKILYSYGNSFQTGTF